jgi:hypothetical protein
MSTLSGGPNIVTNGLVFSLDAANPKSYVSGSTTWNDISRGGNNGTLINGPTFNSGNYGSIVFDGVDDYVPLSGSLNLGSTFTIFSWVYLTSGAGGEYVIYGPSGNGNDNWLSVTSNKVFFFGTQSADVNNFSLIGNSTLLIQKWYQVVLTVNTNTVTLFLNGVQDGTTTQLFTIAPWSGSFNSIGRRGSTSQRYFLGNIANIYAYNRVLSLQEILQNFNAQKSRFGI